MEGGTTGTQGFAAASGMRRNDESDDRSGDGGSDRRAVSNTAKGAAGGLHDVARNEPLRKAKSPATAPRTTSARAEARPVRGAHSL